MRFMTYNIQIGVARAQNPHGQLELFNLQGIADIIKAQTPDVVALQEVDCNRARSGYVDEAGWLAEALGGYYYRFAPAFSEPQPNGDTGYYGNAILSRFPIKEHLKYDLWHRTELFPGEKSWVTEPRCCLTVQLDTPEPVCVAALHLSTTLDQRSPQLEQVADIIAANSPKPTVLMGDFNAKHEELQSVRLAGLMTNILQPTPVFTCPNGVKARSCIDHIWITPNWDTHAVWVVSERRGISDHNPVVADLEIVR